MNKYDDMPPEVHAYYKSGRKKAIQVIGNDDFTLSITFNNNEIRIYDMQENLKGEVFEAFRDIQRFKEVYIDSNGCIAWDIDPNVDSEVVWNNHVDLCPDSCYIYSTPAKENYND